MSKSKFNPLITASIMSAVYMAGVSNVSQAVVSEVTDNNSLSAHVNGSPMSVLPAPNFLGQQRYIVQLNGPAIARFEGNTEFSAIPKKPNGKIDVNSAEVQNYLSHLETEQESLLNSLSGVLGRNLESIRSFQYAYNGLAVMLSPHEVEAVESTSGVRQVTLDRNYFVATDAGPRLIGANNIWGVDGVPSVDIIFANGFEESAPEGEFGAGVVIGTLDSGANFDHPSFAAVSGDGYVHVNPLGSGNYLGVCDPDNTDQYLPDYTCNDKTIGGYDFVHGLEPPDGFDIEGPEDENGHGSHTASTSGGNMLATAEAAGISDIQISGVAPRATHVIFDVCFNDNIGRGLCPGVSSIASVDQAIADGLVDVINFSIGGGSSPWTDPVSEAFLNATASGILVAASAGNSGPGPGTLGHVEPWTISSGASTHDRRFSNAVTVTGPDPVPADLVGALGIQGSGPVMVADMVGTMEYAGNIDGGANVTACAAFTDSLTGLIAVISRGGCSFADKVNNAVAAGAVGVIVHNNVDGDPIVMGGLDATTVPSVMVSQAVGLALDAFIDANAAGTSTVSVSATTSISLDGQPDSMASFSSRGPSPFEYNKPDVTGPGVSILAAFDDDDPTTVGTPAEYGIISGTSMSSPHTAGAAALLRALNPGWSVPEVKSALMMASVTEGLTKEDASTAADPFDRGAGRIQVDAAAGVGLVMDETASNFAFADPDNGGDPKTLNVPSITDYRCVETCTFTRTFRSVADSTVIYDASVVGVPGTVTPSTFTLNPGQFIQLEVEVDGGSMTPGATTFGELVIVENADISFSGSPSVVDIPDDGYDGSLTSMLCTDITVSGITATDVTLQTAITHSWVGDLTIKVENPNDDVLGVMSRPDLVEAADDGEGCCGSNSNLSSADPISFLDGAAVSAEAMPAGFADVNVCTDDGICEYSPAPGSVAQPPATFAELMAAGANGTWTVCVGDSGGGDEGTFDSASLIFPGEKSVSDLHLPMVIIGFPPEPEIDVTPTSLSQSQDPDTTNSQVINIANLPSAGADLNWTITSDLSLLDYKMVDQPESGTNGIVSDVFNGQDNGSGGTFNGGVYSADALVLASDASIEKMSFNGFMSNGDTLSGNVSEMTVTIFNDAGGAPANHPDDGLGGEVYTLTLPIGDANLDTTGDTGVVEFNVLGADGVALDLSAGTYWVTAYAEFTGTNRWNWFAGVDENALNAHLIDPLDNFGAGLTIWTDLTGPVDPIYTGLSYSVSRELACGASWLSTDTASGVNAPNSSTDVTVTFDSAGLAAGDYAAAICIDSNDSDEARVVVPVFLTVNEGP